MSRHTFILTILFCTASASSLFAAGPENSAQPLVELWYIGESAPVKPEVIVLQDGRVQVRSPQGIVESRLGQEELHELVNGLIYADGLRTVKTEEMCSQIHSAEVQSGLQAHVPHSGETVIRIRIGSEYREIRCQAVGILSNRYPELSCVRAMAAAQKRLENLRAVTTVGGPKEAKLIADLATEHLATQYDLTIPITAQNLSMVRDLPDGSRFSQFVVESQSASGPAIHMVSVTQTPGLHPRVSMVDGSAIQ